MALPGDLELLLQEQYIALARAHRKPPARKPAGRLSFAETVPGANGISPEALREAVLNEFIKINWALPGPLSQALPLEKLKKIMALIRDDPEATKVIEATMTPDEAGLAKKEGMMFSERSLRLRNLGRARYGLPPLSGAEPVLTLHERMGMEPARPVDLTAAQMAQVVACEAAREERERQRLAQQFEPQPAPGWVRTNR